jgi:hypothetical protein
MDEYGIRVDRGGKSAVIKRSYTPAQQEARERLIAMIEAEQRAFLRRIEPYQEALTQIEMNEPPPVAMSFLFFLNIKVVQN